MQRTGNFALGEPWQQFPEHRNDLTPGKHPPETQVLSHTERQVRVRFSVDAEDVRVFEQRLVSTPPSRISEA